MRGRWRHVQEGRAHGVGGGNLFVVRHASVFVVASATTTLAAKEDLRRDAYSKKYKHFVKMIAR